MVVDENGVIRALGDKARSSGGGTSGEAVGAELAPLLQVNQRQVYTWEEAEEMLQTGEVWR